MCSFLGERRQADPARDRGHRGRGGRDDPAELQADAAARRRALPARLPVHHAHREPAAELGAGARAGEYYFVINIKVKVNLVM